MEKPIISILKNNTKLSADTFILVREKLLKRGFDVREEFSPQSKLIVSIGGDGATLDTVHKCNFPSIPVVGINTGHLGFFQEVDQNTLDEFIKNYTEGRYCLQPLNPVEAIISFKETEKTESVKGLNEIVIRGGEYFPAHLSLYIGGSFIEKYTGDGLLVATSSGSTAYNYSLGGSIVDPRIKLLQVTPIAPMNTTAYRSFTSSILLPWDLALEIKPEYIKSDKTHIIADGFETAVTKADKITIKVSSSIVNLAGDAKSRII